MANRSTLDRSEATTRRTYKSNRANRKNYCRIKRTKTTIKGGAVMAVQTDEEWFLEHFGRLTKDHQKQIKTIGLKFKKYWKLIETFHVSPQVQSKSYDPKEEPHFYVEVKDPSKIHKVEEVCFYCYADRIEVKNYFDFDQSNEYWLDHYTMTIENFFKYLDQLPKGFHHFAECTND